MKRHRRVEITAFRRRVTILSGEYDAFVDAKANVPPEADAHSLEIIAPESDEGRRLLTEAVSILQDKLAVSDPVDTE